MKKKRQYNRKQSSLTASFSTNSPLSISFIQHNNSFTSFLHSIDWKESYVSLLLGLVVVAFSIGVTLVFAKGKSLNFIVHSPQKPQVVTNTHASSKSVIGERSYVVQDGDDLTDIAAKIYGTEDAWVKLAKANNIDNPDVVVVGQKLIIPH
jgi:LysM repeat protein